MLSPDAQVPLRLAVALLAGGLLGLNRELHGKPAGFSTHALVCLGAATAATAVLRSGNGVPVDPNTISRVIQGILTGIGFIGAGVILRDPAGHVTGLTTAATIWICAVIGFVCALGHWLVLASTLGLTAFALVFGRPLERLVDRIIEHTKPTPPADPTI